MASSRARRRPVKAAGNQRSKSRVLSTQAGALLGTVAASLNRGSDKADGVGYDQGARSGNQCNDVDDCDEYEYESGSEGDYDCGYESRARPVGREGHEGRSAREECQKGTVSEGTRHQRPGAPAQPGEQANWTHFLSKMSADTASSLMNDLLMIFESAAAESAKKSRSGDKKARLKAFLPENGEKKGERKGDRKGEKKGEKKVEKKGERRGERKGEGKGEGKGDKEDRQGIRIHKVRECRAANVQAGNALADASPADDPGTSACVTLTDGAKAQSLEMLPGVTSRGLTRRGSREKAAKQDETRSEAVGVPGVSKVGEKKQGEEEGEEGGSEMETDTDIDDDLRENLVEVVSAVHAEQCRIESPEPYGGLENIGEILDAEELRWDCPLAQIYSHPTDQVIAAMKRLHQLRQRVVTELTHVTHTTISASTPVAPSRTEKPKQTVDSLTPLDPANPDNAVADKSVVDNSVVDGLCRDLTRIRKTNARTAKYAPAATPESSENFQNLVPRRPEHISPFVIADVIVTLTPDRNPAIAAHLANAVPNALVALANSLPYVPNPSPPPNASAASGDASMDSCDSLSKPTSLSSQPTSKTTSPALQTAPHLASTGAGNVSPAGATAAAASKPAPRPKPQPFTGKQKRFARNVLLRPRRSQRFTPSLTALGVESILRAVLTSTAENPKPNGHEHTRASFTSAIPSIIGSNSGSNSGSNIGSNNGPSLGSGVGRGPASPSNKRSSANARHRRRELQEEARREGRNLAALNAFGKQVTEALFPNGGAPQQLPDLIMRLRPFFQLQAVDGDLQTESVSPPVSSPTPSLISSPISKNVPRNVSRMGSGNVAETVAKPVAAGSLLSGVPHETLARHLGGRIASDVLTWLSERQSCLQRNPIVAVKEQDGDGDENGFEDGIEASLDAFALTSADFNKWHNSLLLARQKALIHSPIPLSCRLAKRVVFTHLNQMNSALEQGFRNALSLLAERHTNETGNLVKEESERICLWPAGKQIQPLTHYADELFDRATKSRLVDTPDNAFMLRPLSIHNNCGLQVNDSLANYYKTSGAGFALIQLLDLYISALPECHKVKSSEILFENGGQNLSDGQRFIRTMTCLAKTALACSHLLTSGLDTPAREGLAFEASQNQAGNSVVADIPSILEDAINAANAEIAENACGTESQSVNNKVKANARKGATAGGKKKRVTTPNKSTPLTAPTKSLSPATLSLTRSPGLAGFAGALGNPALLAGPRTADKSALCLPSCVECLQIMFYLANLNWSVPIFKMIKESMRKRAASDSAAPAAESAVEKVEKEGKVVEALGIEELGIEGLDIEGSRLCKDKERVFRGWVNAELERERLRLRQQRALCLYSRSARGVIDGEKQPGDDEDFELDLGRIELEYLYQKWRYENLELRVHPALRSLLLSDQVILQPLRALDQGQQPDANAALDACVTRSSKPQPQSPQSPQNSQNPQSPHSQSLAGTDVRSREGRSSGSAVTVARAVSAVANAVVGSALTNSAAGLPLLEGIAGAAGNGAAASAEMVPLVPSFVSENWDGVGALPSPNAELIATDTKRQDRLHKTINPPNPSNPLNASYDCADETPPLESESKSKVTSKLRPGTRSGSRSGSRSNGVGGRDDSEKKSRTFLYGSEGRRSDKGQCLVLQGVPADTPDAVFFLRDVANAIVALNFFGTSISNEALLHALPSPSNPSMHKVGSTLAALEGIERDGANDRHTYPLIDSHTPTGAHRHRLRERTRRGMGREKEEREREDCAGASVFVLPSLMCERPAFVMQYRSHPRFRRENMILRLRESRNFGLQKEARISLQDRHDFAAFASAWSTTATQHSAPPESSHGYCNLICDLLWPDSERTPPAPPAGSVEAEIPSASQQGSLKVKLDNQPTLEDFDQIMRQDCQVLLRNHPSRGLTTVSPLDQKIDFRVLQASRLDLIVKGSQEVLQSLRLLCLLVRQAAALQILTFALKVLAKRSGPAAKDWRRKFGKEEIGAEIDSALDALEIKWEATRSKRYDWDAAECENLPEEFASHRYRYHTMSGDIDHYHPEPFKSMVLPALGTLDEVFLHIASAFGPVLDLLWRLSLRWPPQLSRDSQTFRLTRQKTIDSIQDALNELVLPKLEDLMQRGEKANTCAAGDVAPAQALASAVARRRERKRGIELMVGDLEKYLFRVSLGEIRPIDSSDRLLESFSAKYYAASLPAAQ